MPVKIKENIKQYIRPIWYEINKKCGFLRANIRNSVGNLPIEQGKYTFVVVVGPSFDQDIPNAMMTCRMAYCNAFEEKGVPYIIVDLQDLNKILPILTNPFCMIFGSDYEFINRQTIKTLKKYKHFVWVDPWFKESENFFKKHNLDSSVWTWSDKHRKKILDSEPTFVYTATVEPGLCFFEEWQSHGIHLISLPLACDTSLYNKFAPHIKEFENVRLAFVGGYWESKGKQIDKYLRLFEDDLEVFGYNSWPYRNYRGKISRMAEPSLYRQALISPTINEPTVKLLHGQINERVFKVLGCGGMTIVDAVPSYRELFSEDELIIPEDEVQFKDIVNELLRNETLRDEYSRKGYDAVQKKHTYAHRVSSVLKELKITL